MGAFAIGVCHAAPIRVVRERCVGWPCNIQAEGGELSYGPVRSKVQSSPVVKLKYTCVGPMFTIQRESVRAVGAMLFREHEVKQCVVGAAALDICGYTHARARAAQTTHTPT